LRDPDSNIWEDDFLLLCWNDAQRDLQQKASILENVQAINIPPEYQMSYIHDWEYEFCDHDGMNYQCLNYNHQSDYSYCYRWESQILAGLSAVESDQGYHFTHPWEGFACGDPGDLIPVWFPVGFNGVSFIAWDRTPIDPLTVKEIQADDMSWKTRNGVPIGYYTLDESSREFYLYPIPDDPGYIDYSIDVNRTIDDGSVRTTSDGRTRTFNDGIQRISEGNMITIIDGDTANIEYGTIIDRTGQEGTQDYGLAYEAVEADDNVLMVYDAMPSDLLSDTDESELPSFLTKYVEYDVLERAYSAHSDGMIESLRDYWGYRRTLGLEVLKKYKTRKRVDREYRLMTKETPGRRYRGRPRLPDDYPDIW
jgi:hypothetical protein